MIGNLTYTKVNIKNFYIDYSIMSVIFKYLIREINEHVYNSR